MQNYKYPNPGGAPEEYQSLYDVYIDKEMKQIELLDMNGKRYKNTV